MDDEALLDEELHWRSRPGHRRRPAGSNAITALGIVLTLAAWGITLLVLRPVLEGPSGSGVIDPKSVVVLVVMGVEMLVAAGIATRVWVGIGPAARRALRPFGVLGPWPMIGIAFLATLWLVSLFAAPFLPKKPRPATSGRNWHFAKTDRYGATYEQALHLCQSEGARVPSRDDLARFDPPFPRGTSVWLEKMPGADYLSLLTADGRVARTYAVAGRRPPHEHVVCFRPEGQSP